MIISLEFMISPEFKALINILIIKKQKYVLRDIKAFYKHICDPLTLRNQI